MTKFNLKFDAALILELAERYYYPEEDKIINEIAPSAKSQGYFTKEQFQQLCLWKTSRSKSRVSLNPAPFIEEATRISLATPIEEIRVGVLTLLHGVLWPTASTMLHFAHRDPYPILDVRALWSLGVDPPPSFYTFGYWWDYTQFCRALAEKNAVSMRVLDRALWQYSKENQSPV